MKKFIIGLACGIVISLSSAAFASDSIHALLFPAKFDFNGKAVDPGEDYTVLNYQGHAYAPIRFVAEHIGATVDYETDTGMIFIKNQALNLTDPEYPSVSVGNLILIKEGQNTKVTGQLKLAGMGDADNMIGAILSFYDDKSVKIGEVTILGSHFGESIQTFEERDAGDFRAFASVKLHIGALNGQAIGNGPNLFPFISKDAALDIAKKLDSRAVNTEWKAELINGYYTDSSTKENRPIWKVTATYRPFGNKMIVDLDAVTGQQLTISDVEPPMSP